MLSVRQLFVSGSRGAPILRGVSLTVEMGSCVALTGPSGSGKTTLIRAILGMDSGTLTVDSGEILLDGADALKISPKVRRTLCGKVFGFIPQNPMTAFFRNAKIGSQLVETLRLHTGLGKTQAQTLAKDCLRRVNLTDTNRVMNAYPGQLSGGMLQRVTMASLLATKPSYILADEPTSALDPENRSLLLEQLCSYRENAGILFLSHDAEAMKSLCSTAHVLENGAVIESGETAGIFDAPKTPWTQAFAAAAESQGEESVTWKRLK